MITTLVYTGILLIIATILYVAYRQHGGQLQIIDKLIEREASTKGLKTKALQYPTFKEWNEAPFKKEMKVGAIGFEGFPFDREYYRILKCTDSAGISKLYWVKVIKSHRTRTFTTEWLEQN